MADDIGFLQLACVVGLQIGFMIIQTFGPRL